MTYKRTGARAGCRWGHSGRGRAMLAAQASMCLLALSIPAQHRFNVTGYTVDCSAEDWCAKACRHGLASPAGGRRPMRRMAQIACLVQPSGQVPHASTFFLGRITSMPIMNGRSTSGITTLPSACGPAEGASSGGVGDQERREAHGEGQSG